MLSIEERFWQKVDKNGPIMPGMETACWIWTAGKSSDGYGRLYNPGRRSHPLYASRVSWEIHRGPIPAKLRVCHDCDNPPCVNPDHLWVGTHQDNMRDRDAKGRGYDRRGERNGRAKISDDAVDAIKAAWEQRDASQTELARAHGISQAQVSRIVRGVQRV